MKKLLALLLTLALSLTAIPAAFAQEDLVALSKADANFNPTGLPIVKDTVKKTIMIRKPANIADPSEMATLNYIAEQMNIDIEWIVVGADGW
ncbi:MAG: sugar ABC transporter substrate-binding protein, partial [Clostridia bacterium]